MKIIFICFINFEMLNLIVFEMLELDKLILILIDFWGYNMLFIFKLLNLFV